MGFFSKLFGGKQEAKAPAVDPVEHKGFLIYPEAKSEGGQFRINGRITKGEGDDLKTHHFIRSDVLASKDDANEFMLKKAKMFIDQMGDNIFG